MSVTFSLLFQPSNHSSCTAYVEPWFAHSILFVGRQGRTSCYSGASRWMAIKPSHAAVSSTSQHSSFYYLQIHMRGLDQIIIADQSWRLIKQIRNIGIYDALRQYSQAGNVLGACNNTEVLQIQRKAFKETPCLWMDTDTAVPALKTGRPGPTYGPWLSVLPIVPSSYQVLRAHRLL